MAELESLLCDIVVDNNIADQSAVDLVVCINGRSEDTFNDIIEVKTMYHDVPQLFACERDSYYFSDELKEYYDLHEDDEEEEEEEDDDDDEDND